MNEKVLRTLEYDKIIDRLCDLASSEAGKGYVKKLRPMTELTPVIRALTSTGDALNRLMKNGNISFAGVHDVTDDLERLSIGASLNAAELLSVASLLEIAGRAKRYGLGEDTEPPKDSLSDLFRDLSPLVTLRTEITRCIPSEEEIADAASPELAQIRRKMGGMNGRIREKLNGMINSASVRDCLSDSVVTLRDGRHCLPVRAEFKSKISGVVHDTSSSGATIFIEPSAVVELNNELRALKSREAEEIDRILANLSEQVAEHSEEIAQDFAILAELDFIFAKGALALEMNASNPRINQKGIIRLRGARHPLLSKDTVVPIDVSLGEKYHQLVVTGPNTGGKTVSLKTVGLLCLMGQSGLFIPAKDRSKITLFSEIYADIGDEQSIEQSLSTFSSHMKNITGILANAKQNPRRTLVLFDELCAGTDPAEGAALATAILDKLRRKGVRTMATTHYSELKLYALSEDGVENASCEFDVNTLSPTYRLIVGIPGKSNAFAISRRIGLSEGIIEDAAKRMNENDRSFEDMIVDLEQRRHALEEQKSKVDAERESLAKQREDLQKKNRRLDEQREDILTKANEKASNILRDAKQSADAAIRNINKYGANADMKKLEAQRQNLGKKLSHTQEKSQKKAPKPEKRDAIDPKKLRLGDSVHVISLNLDGTIHTLPDARGNLTVQMGIMSSKVNLNDLILLEDKSEKPKAKAASGTKSHSKAATMSAELKLLGMYADEAVIALDKFIDDAVLSNLKTIRVVHGKGSGILRSAVHARLKNHPSVESFRLAEYGEGDTGVTIVEL